MRKLGPGDDIYEAGEYLLTGRLPMLALLLRRRTSEAGGVFSHRMPMRNACLHAMRQLTKVGRRRSELPRGPQIVAQWDGRITS